MTTKKKKKQFKIKNWNQYDQALKQRGSITLAIEEKTLKKWEYKGNKKRGANRFYSNLAIEVCLSLRQLLGLRMRQTEGFVISLFELMKVQCRVPDHTTLSRRAASLSIKLPKLNNNENIVLLIDSTGLKVFGEGEWKARKHGSQKRRTWRKLHIVIDANTQIIHSSELTENSIEDSQMVEICLQKHLTACSTLIGDGAYDKKKVYEHLHKEGIRPLVPPRKNAVVSTQADASWQRRNVIVQYLKGDKSRRKKWKIKTKYHRRSLVETTMARYKRTFGHHLMSRSMSSQKTEVLLNCVLLNKMWNLGQPESYKVN